MENCTCKTSAPLRLRVLKEVILVHPYNPRLKEKFRRLKPLIRTQSFFYKIVKNENISKLFLQKTLQYVNKYLLLPHYRGVVCAGGTFSAQQTLFPAI